MKKSMLLSLLGLTTAIAPSFGQGYIVLDNDNAAPASGWTYVTYGEPGIPANGISGPDGTVASGFGGGLVSGWTAGFYYTLGDITGSLTGGNVAGTGLPTDQNASFVLGTGTG